jgi:hypothetical protein
MLVMVPEKAKADGVLPQVTVCVAGFTDAEAAKPLVTHVSW